MICRYTPGDKEVQQVGYAVMICRPVVRFACAEVGTVATTIRGEERSSFGREKALATGDMSRVPVGSDEKS